MNMKKWLADQLKLDVKKAFPILSFPSTQLLNISVKDLIASSEMQANGMKMIADRHDSAASVSMMDLSVEAEAFGSDIKVYEDEVPAVVGRIVKSQADADVLQVPKIGTGRTALFIDAISKAVELIKDRPVFAGVIGPFSLAGRLMDMTEIMVNCYVEPDMVHTTLKKATQFIIDYILAYKQAGAHGVMLAEPAAGLLSPDLDSEFASPYVKQIVDAVQDDEFALVYHNCGNVIPLIPSILSTGSAAYHFGNATKMAEIMQLFPSDIVVMGNIDPAAQFRNGTPESIAAETTQVMNECCHFKNFLISSGCDIPPLASWDNIDAFYAAVKAFYSRN